LEVLFPEKTAHFGSTVPGKNVAVSQAKRQTPNAASPEVMDATKSLSIYFLLLATMLVHCQGWKKSKYWGLQDGAPKNKPCYSWMCQDRTITTTGNIIIIFYFVSLHTNIYCYTVVGF